MAKFDHDQYVFEGFDNPAQLDTQEKLQALRDDAHAGFLPFSHSEKTKAIEMLDYLGDRRQYPAGLGNRLQEIFMRNKRDLGIAEARRAMFSLAYEYGDFAANASHQVAALTALSTELATEHMNPGVTIAEDFPDGHVGLPAVVRFVDVLAAREQRTLITPYDPLKVSEQRFVAANSEDEKPHKVIGDRYTAAEVPAEVEQRIASFSDGTTIAQLRPLVWSALVNEEYRLDFWMNRLHDTRAHGAAWIIGKQLIDQLETVEA